jgi:hypothetical protein
MNNIIYITILLLHLLLRNSYFDQRFIVDGLAHGAAPGLHCCGWRVLENYNSISHRGCQATSCVSIGPGP